VIRWMHRNRPEKGCVSVCLCRCVMCRRINETVWRIGMGVLLSIKRPNEFDWFAPSEREYLTIKVRR